MTPDDLELVRADTAHVAAHADGFTETFYRTVFDLAPSVRSMFPDDLSDQRRKLLAELAALIDSATALGGSEPHGFVGRAQALGRRHSSYGVVGDHYAVVGTALIAALADTVPDWNEHRERTWATLYRLVADTMRSGATAATPPDGADIAYKR
jgi:nitric oxide dioxygenase